MPSLGRRSAAEGVATFLLVFIGVGAIATDARTGAIGHLGISLTFGLVVSAMVYATGHLSGAHLNPAVTLAFRALGRVTNREALAYSAAQVGGAVAAAWVVAAAIGLPGETGATIPAVPLLSAWILEASLTATLMFVIAAVATDTRAVGALAGIAIGSVVAAGALVGGPLSGGSMNPARSFGPALVTGSWQGHWIYWMAPCCGSVMGALGYRFVARAPDGAYAA